MAAPLFISLFPFYFCFIFRFSIYSSPPKSSVRNSMNCKFSF
ncbi:uncharacterized protein J3R85_018897 [Psidium guajava]|nr:uncharacterized protein J3R85_018897 [Psidium guajava]